MSANNIAINNMSMMHEFIPALTIPAPIFDQLQISIWNGMDEDIILPIFREYFGKPQCIKGHQGKVEALRWNDLGISMSAWENHAHRVIRFSASQPVLAALTPVLRLFPARYDGKPAARLKSAEIAWDFPISHKYQEADDKLIHLAQLAVPANKFARLRAVGASEYAKQEFKRCTDGATNGRISCYFKSLSRQPDKEDPSITKLAPTLKAVWRGIIYCKQLAPNEPWCIRFEATLLGPKLEKVIGKSLPSDLTRLPRRLTRLCFDDFWGFERFDWDAFMEAARRSANYNKIPFERIERRTRVLHAVSKPQGIEATISLKHSARKIAKMLKSQSLRNRIGAKEFSTRLTLMDVFHLHTVDE